MLAWLFALVYGVAWVHYSALAIVEVLKLKLTAIRLEAFALNLMEDEIAR